VNWELGRERLSKIPGYATASVGIDASERRAWKQKEKAQSTMWKWKRSKRM